MTPFLLSISLLGQTALWPAKTYYRYADVEGHKIFYREAGDPRKPAILLLHGYPASSHSYRELIPLLSGRYHVVAPDNLGSGFSDHPDPDQTTYTFDLLAHFTDGFVRVVGLKRYALYMQDFGAPVGFRLMMLDPARVEVLIVQNANAYLDGLTPARQQFFKDAHDDRSPEGIAKLYAAVSREGIVQRQYLRDVKGKEEVMSPDAWTSDLARLESEKDRKIQVQLFQDYYNNLLAYPRWQAFLRERQFPTLIVWGQNDPAFIAAGARAYLRDLRKAELHLLDTGHFAVEEKAVDIAKYIVRFLDGQSSRRRPKKSTPSTGVS